jgi:tetratricopeptide (TPR) repeat protein
MRSLLLFFSCLFSFWVSAQNDQLALDYFEKGEFEKAVTLYEEIHTKQPTNLFFFEKLLHCYRQLQQFDKAENLIEKRKQKYNQPTMQIELGYNFQLQKQQDKANKYYQLALDEIQKEPNYAYQLGSNFEKKTLLDWALKAYELGQKFNPNLNFDYQMALLQGQMGNVELMIDKLFDYAYAKPEFAPTVQSFLSRFLMENANESFPAYVKKTLLIRTQKTPDIFWNQFLSWFYVQQKEYDKAFIQERAIYKRNPESFYEIVTLAQLAIEDNQDETAKTILTFVLENTSDVGLQMQAHHFLMKMKIENATAKDYPQIQLELQELVKKFGVSPYSLKLQLLLANFEAFYRNQPKKAIEQLQKTLELPLNLREAAAVKMELADIMVYDEKFNQAILYYAQVEDNLKNDELAHEASMKMAKANYYKADFEWTLQQVKNLKQSSSLLIANDAIELFMLIQDNSVEDSTKTALTAFAKADLKLYQKKKDEALQAFLTILEKHKGESIQDITLLRIAQIYEQKKQFDLALNYYNKILTDHADGIFVDEALYFSAEIYRIELNQPEKAKPLYERMVLNHPDSIYFTNSRINYRILRGDVNL